MITQRWPPLMMFSRGTGYPYVTIARSLIWMHRQGTVSNVLNSVKVFSFAKVAAAQLRNYTSVIPHVNYILNQYQSHLYVKCDLQFVCKGHTEYRVRLHDDCIVQWSCRRLRSRPSEPNPVHPVALQQRAAAVSFLSYSTRTGFGNSSPDKFKAKGYLCSTRLASHQRI